MLHQVGSDELAGGRDIEDCSSPNLLEFLSESRRCADYESLVVTCNMLYLLSNCSWIQYLKYGVLEEASECAFVWSFQATLGSYRPLNSASMGSYVHSCEETSKIY